MYNPFQLAIKYGQYWCRSANGKGHGIHSPFIFEMVTKVFNKSKKRFAFNNIEKLRHQLLNNDSVIVVQDFGAGSRIIKDHQRKISTIAKSSLKPQKFGQLFFSLVQFYQPATIIELGTSFGISTAYFASANSQTQVFTFEGAKEIAAIAKQNFETLVLQNIHQVIGNFDDTLSSQLKNFHVIDMAYIDGNHRLEPTINYFNALLTKCNAYSIIIVDDIHWSKEMEQAWQYIQHHELVTATVDLFFIGIVLLRNEFKQKQHFSIKY
jgi:predicted O-methyltransferase YrrM